MTPTRAKMIVSVTTVIWAVLGSLSLIPAGFSVMMFDAPGSERNVATITLVCSMLGFPLSCVVAAILSHQKMHQGNFSTACLWACLPLLVIAVGGTALTWICLVQGGHFNR